MSVERIIFPGILVGCLFLVFATSLIASPHIALAQSSAPEPALSGAAAGSEQAAAGQGQKGGEAAAQNNQAQEKAANNTNQAEKPAGDCMLSQGYPESVRQWCGLITQYASRHSLDPNLVAAVMQQESGGNPQAYSKSGAVGLLQVMPRDGLASSFMCINGPCFSNRPTTDELYDPEFNVSYGTEMLAGLIQKKGDIREALRSYGPINMGYQYADIILSIMNRNQ